MSNFAPAGSYTLTTQQITSTLYCQAKTPAGTSVSAGLDLTNLTNPRVENMNGFLINGGDNGTQTGYVPGGHFGQSSSGIQVILAGLATTPTGQQVWSTLDITKLDPSKTVSNINGVLTVD